VANSKQKPTPEGSQRRPGKTKFAIPRREAPPIDGSYLDRLFADYDKQTKELEGQAADTGPEVELTEGKEVTSSQPPVESAPPAQVSEEATTQVASLRPPDVTIPFRPHQIVPAEPEPTDDLSPAELAAIETPDVRPAASAEQSPMPPPDVTVVGVDDEPLLERWKKRHRLSKGEVKVLRVMTRMCRESGGDHCYVKILQLMADAELKERQTQLVLRSLRELGLVEKVAEYSNADRMGTKYRILFEAK
jgi:hypothetical protein